MGFQSLSLATAALEAVLNPPVDVYKTDGNMIYTTNGMKRSRTGIEVEESFAMGDLLQALTPLVELGDFPTIGWFDDDAEDDEESTTTSDSTLNMPAPKRRFGGLVRSQAESDLASLAVDSSPYIRHFLTTTGASHPLRSLSKISTISLSKSPLSSLCASGLPPSRPQSRQPISPRSLSLSKLAYSLLDPSMTSFPGGTSSLIISASTRARRINTPIFTHGCKSEAHGTLVIL
jgi:hypothetical protein